MAATRASMSKMVGSGLAKNFLWRERRASSTSSSLTMKLMLISLAPCEIMRTLTCEMEEKTWPEMPGLPRMSSPTRQMRALLPSYLTSAILLRSAEMAGRASLESTVTETEISEVETMSMAQPCLSKMAKTAARKPWARSMRLATMSMMVSFFLAAMDLKGLAQGGAMAVMLGAFVFGVARVENEDGDVLLHGREDGRGVQDFGAEVG
jgi:hypothetical protein